MILIFGGVHQGKLNYALERFGLTDSDVCQCGNGVDMPQGKKIIYEIDKWIYNLVEMDLDVQNAIQECIDSNPDAIFICNDITCGVVPVETILRKWREAVGRSLAQLAGASDEVIRVFFGLPTQIK